MSPPVQPQTPLQAQFEQEAAGSLTDLQRQYDAEQQGEPITESGLGAVGQGIAAGIKGFIPGTIQFAKEAAVQGAKATYAASPLGLADEKRGEYLKGAGEFAFHTLKGFFYDPVENAYQLTKGAVTGE